MLVQPDDLEKQMRDEQVVTTILEAVPLVLEASSYPCCVCATCILESRLELMEKALN